VPRRIVALSATECPIAGTNFRPLSEDAPTAAGHALRFVAQIAAMGCRSMVLYSSAARKLGGPGLAPEWVLQLRAHVATAECEWVCIEHQGYDALQKRLRTGGRKRAARVLARAAQRR